MLAGALCLTALQVVVTSKETSRLAGLLSVPGTIAEHFLNPNVPAIPDRRGA